MGSRTGFEVIYLTKGTPAAYWTAPLSLLLPKHIFRHWTAGLMPLSDMLFAGSTPS
jgi:hypothetical protein